MSRSDRRDDERSVAVVRMSAAGRPGHEAAAVPFVERPVLFDCEGERLVGIVAVPEIASRVAVLVIVGGPQYRAGAHRQFVDLSRRLAAAGIPAMRFDYRGMGDSTGVARTFEDCGPDIAAAIDALMANCPEVAHVVLWGLCDAASAALDYWQSARDPRVAAMALLNPWVRSEATLAKAHIKHYYAQRLASREFWSKLVNGGFAPATALAGFARNVLSALSRPQRVAGRDREAFQYRMAAGLRAFPGPILLLLSGDDLTAKEFLEYAQSDARWRGLLQRAGLERHDLPDADHTFSSAEAADEMLSRTLSWVRASVASGPR